MNTALVHNKEFNFGKVVNADYSTKKLKYTCLKCGEEVYLKRGDHNKPHFSHYKHGNNIENECEERASNTFGKKLSYKDLDKFKSLNKWFIQQNNNSTVYLPQLPEVIFDDEVVWKSLADILIVELNNSYILTKYDFSSKIVKGINVGNSKITHYFITLCNEKFKPNKLIDLYWELYIRFRLLYRIFKKQDKTIFESYYLQLVTYIDENILNQFNENIPVKINYNEQQNEIYCRQEFEQYTRSIKLLDLPYNIDHKDNPPEVQNINLHKYLIAVFDEFENCYITTNGQVTIGSEVLILAEKTILLKFKKDLEDFSEIQIESPQVNNLTRDWGMIIAELERPTNLPFGYYPNWVSFRYIDFWGGLKISKSNISNSYMLNCPPAIKLNVNLPNSAISVTNSKNQSIKFVREGDLVRLLEPKIGNYFIYIKKTPYNLKFSLSTSSIHKIIHEENKWSWIFSDKWPCLNVVNDEKDKLTLTGCKTEGCWGSHNLINRNREWYLKHSGLITEVKNNINKLL